MKDIKCKCAHLESEHRKIVLGVRLECNICPCSKYLRFNRPDLFDKFMAIFGFFSIILLSVVFVIIYQNFPNENGGIKDSFIVTLFGFIGLAILYNSEMVTNYIKYKKRKDWNL